MLLLNVSDIHFNHPICNSLTDADRPFRTRLIQDARDRSAPSTLFWSAVTSLTRDSKKSTRRLIPG
jgi:hypothetical protein